MTASDSSRLIHPRVVAQIRDDAEWRELRQHFVGSSEVAALFGESPYLTRYGLYHAKRGDAGFSIPKPSGERLDGGRYFEPAIAAWAQQKWSFPLRKVRRYLAHPTVDGMGCTLDYETARGQRLSTEIKLVDPLQFKREWLAEGDEIVEPPLHIQLQVQHQLAITGKDGGWLIVCVGGSKLMRHYVAAREQTIRLIEGEVAAFWEDVRAGREPAADYDRDGALIARRYREAGLRGVTLDLSGDNRIDALCRTYSEAGRRKREAEKAVERARAEILDKAKGADRVTTADWEINLPLIAAATVSYEREPYRRLLVKEAKKETNNAA